MHKRRLLRPATRDRIFLAGRSFLATLAVIALIGLAALAARIFLSQLPLPPLLHLLLWSIGGIAVAAVVTLAEQMPFWRERISVKPKR
jgi:hypothetical protein